MSRHCKYIKTNLSTLHHSCYHISSWKIYEIRREFLGTRCERYISQFTYYCGNADHARPLPRETFYRQPKVLAQNECRALQMGQYRAGDSKTCSIALVENSLLMV